MNRSNIFLDAARVCVLLTLFLSTLAFSEGKQPQAALSGSDRPYFTVSSRGLDIKLSAFYSMGPGIKVFWALGDGSQATGQSLSHRYNKPGRYAIEMRVQGSNMDTSATGEVDISMDTAMEKIAGKKLTPETTHLTNPFLGADRYINPDYASSIQQSIQKTSDRTLIGKMRTLESVPTAIWLDRIDAIYGGALNGGRSSLEEHLLRTLAQQKPGTPITIELVIYNLPNRDCAALSSSGTLDFRSGGIEKYKKDYIDVIHGLLNDPRFASIRFILIVEPDSLPNMVTNLWHPKCALVAENGVYTQSIRYAIERFSEIKNAYIFLDIGHSGWLGHESNMDATVKYLAEEIAKSKIAQPLHAVDGFVTNTSNFTPTEEVFLPDPELEIDGASVKSGSFYRWNSVIDEKKFTEALHRKLVQAGFSPDIHFLIDTSRNGWGGKNRPSSPLQNVGVEKYVDSMRLDRRFDRGNWCNQLGAGLGERPMFSPFGSNHPVAAFIWVKPPGESDGSSDPIQSGSNSEGKGFDPTCSPNYIVSHGPYPSNKPTGAMPNAPTAGHWFHEQFLMLIENAYPPVQPSPRKEPLSFPEITAEKSQTFFSSHP